MDKIIILVCGAYCGLALYGIIFRVKSIKKSLNTFKATGDKTILYSEAIWAIVTLAIVIFLVYQSKLLQLIIK